LNSFARLIILPSGNSRSQFLAEFLRAAPYAYETQKDGARLDRTGLLEQRI